LLRAHNEAKSGPIKLLRQAIRVDWKTPTTGSRGDIMKKTSEIYKRKIFLIIRLTLLFVLAYSVFRTAMILRNGDNASVSEPAIGSESEIPVVSKESKGEPGENPESSVRDYSAILERNLFGHPALSMDKEDDLKANDVSDPDEETKEELSIALLGTVAGNSKVSRAIIEDLETNISGLFKVGDSIGNASIENIEKDAVVVLHQGQRKTVHLGAKGSKQYQADKMKSMVARNSTPANEGDQQDEPPKTAAEKLRYAATMLPKAVIQPYAVEGKVEGLRLTGLEKIRYMEDIGLRNGDVIRTVNGHRLTSKQKAFQISRKARSQAVVSIELMRDNKIKTFSFHLGQVVVKSRNAGRGMKTDANRHVI